MSYDHAMHFAVVGAGNMGCVYGGNLARIGQEVSMIDIWEEHIDAIRRDGLRISGLRGDYTVRVGAATSPAGIPKADVVLICVNSYSTKEAGLTASAILKDQGYVLTLQNGVGNVETLTGILGAGRLLAGLSFQSGDLESPGKVAHTNNGETFLGELDRARTERLETIRALFDQAGLNPVLVDDVVTTIWAKFVHNCGINALCAITGLRPGEIHEVPSFDEFQTGIIEETVALVRAKGIVLPDADPVSTIKEYCAHKFHRPSMMQHLDRGQLTEIDSLNGYVARESAHVGMAAPCNDALTRIMHGRQHRRRRFEDRQ
jgi:2-dehydropantoate 2-reductase